MMDYVFETGPKTVSATSETLLALFARHSVLVEMGGAATAKGARACAWPPLFVALCLRTIPGFVGSCTVRRTHMSNVCPLVTWASWLHFLLADEQPRHATTRAALLGNKTFLLYVVEATVAKLYLVRSTAHALIARAGGVHLTGSPRRGCGHGQMDKDGDLDSAVYPQLCTVATVLWRQLLLPHYGVLGDDAVKQKDKVRRLVDLRGSRYACRCR